MSKNLFSFLLSLLFLPLIYFFVYINTEYLYQFDLLNSLTITYIVYFLVSIYILFISKKFKNTEIRSDIVYLGKFFLFFLILILPGIFLTHSFIAERIGDINLYLRAYGRVAFFYFALALVISPLLNFVKKENIKENFILARKVFGILAFLFFLKHGLEYFSMEFIYQYTYHKEQSYLKYTYDNLLIRWDALSGVLPGILMIILGITSNKTSLKIFGGRFWKSIQSMVYPAFILSVIHVAFTSRFDSFYIFLVGFVVTIRLIAYSIDKSKKTSGITTKYKCIPCGYIYDEIAGDPDSGINPGTKFEDIPDNWTCPVCGVSKKDFEPFYEGENTVFGGYMGEVSLYNMLTEDVLELEIALSKKVDVIPGQYASIILNDFDGDFTRSFSVVEQNGNNIKFAIKLKIDGRAGRKLRLMKIGEHVKIKGIYGNFILRNTPNPKVFIASGTGLAPMINMFKSNNFSNNNKLFFGVRSKSDVFYEELLRSFANLEVNIFLSKEEAEGYNYGRMDLSKYDFDINTEFYICGNPSLVAETFKFLEEKGYKNIYSEKFN